jgi:hypothetical protein
MSSFPGLDPFAAGDTYVDTAQRFLASAYDSVAALFDVHYPAIRGLRAAGRGRLTHAEGDIFRAAIIFAGAGVDATLKELIRTAVPVQVERSDTAREKFRDFVSIYLSGSQGIDSRRLADIIIAPKPRHVILEEYVRRLTGSSLQSVQQVHDTLSALGLTTHAELYKSARELQRLFEARNQIAHELDLKSPEQRGDRRRHERKINESRLLCHSGLNFAQKVINTVIAETGTEPSPEGI